MSIVWFMQNYLHTYGWDVMGEDFIIEAEGVTKRFGKVIALNNVNLKVPSGVVGLIGPNGAGKTTLINIIIGLVKPTRGRVSVFGCDSWKERSKVLRVIGVLHEGAPYPTVLTAIKFLEYVARIKGLAEPKVEADMAIKKVGLGWARNRKIATFSTGMMQRLGLAQAIIGRPRLVILDEPTSNLDPIGRVNLLNLIHQMNREEGISFLISTHILPELERIADYAIFMHEGHVLESGSLDELVKKHLNYDFSIWTQHPERLAEALHSKDYVKQVNVKDGAVLVNVEDRLRFAMNLPVIAAEHNLPLIEIRQSRRNLEEVFMALLGDEDAGNAYEA